MAHLVSLCTSVCGGWGQGGEEVEKEARARTDEENPERLAG